MALSNIEFANALRKVADFYERHPHFCQPLKADQLLEELAAFESDGPPVQPLPLVTRLR
jgi:hypothetical protein